MHRHSRPILPTPRAAVVANAAANPLDVLWLKSALRALGLYEAPDWGVTHFPDRALFDAVRAFQEGHGLKRDGTVKPDGETWDTLQSTLNDATTAATVREVAQAFQALGRNGDSILAHITPEEAALLKAHGGSGTTNPATGLPEFFTDRQLEAAEKANRGTARNRARVRHYVNDMRQRNGNGDARSAKAIRAEAWTEAKAREQRERAERERQEKERQEKERQYRDAERAAQARADEQRRQDEDRKRRARQHRSQTAQEDATPRSGRFDATWGVQAGRRRPQGRVKCPCPG